MNARITHLKASQVREFLLRESSYCTFDLPQYFDFSEVLGVAASLIEKQQVSDKALSDASKFEGVNYGLYTNKDGAYAWRMLELIHPIFYAKIVETLTEESTWALIQSKFGEFESVPSITCSSIPTLPSEIETQTGAAISSWWHGFEQESLALALDFKHLITADISDCYGSFYTHTIPWALHGKSEAKRIRNETLAGNQLDKLFQYMHNGQTNGIPQGNMVSNLVAELVLGYADSELGKRLSTMDLADFRILRFRDDYRIFTKTQEQGSRIVMQLSGVLAELNFRLNSAKSKSTDDVISGSLKPDKLDSIQRGSSGKSLQKTLLRIHQFSLKHPNSGSVGRGLARFRIRLEKIVDRPTDIEVLISIVADIMKRNLLAIPAAVSVLSYLLNLVSADEARTFVTRIFKKFDDVPNGELVDIWMQRIDRNYVRSDDASHSGLCAAPLGQPVELWCSGWLDGSQAQMLSSASLLHFDILREQSPVITIEETEAFLQQYDF